MPDHGLLTPGTSRTAALADDAAVARAMLDVEVAWVRSLGAHGVVSRDVVDRVAEAAAVAPDVASLSARAESGANPVIPLVTDLRAALAATSPEAARWVHRGLTSQDVLDSALMLVARRVLDAVVPTLTQAARAAGELARTHRGTVMAGRTLTQWAAPITFGLKASGWAEALLDARDDLVAARAGLAAQCGGAVGTLAALTVVAPGVDPLALSAGLADALGLPDAGRPWHVVRGRVTRLGDALVGAADALGHVATDVTTLSRPEIGELREPGAPGRGGSSTMPHKRNPVLSLQIRRVALQAPALGSTLHLASAVAVDERPDGAWHAEWQPLRSLLVDVSAAAQLGAELLGGLEVDADAMRRNLDAAGPSVLSERLSMAGVDPSSADPALLDPTTYVGVAGALVDRTLARLSEEAA